MNRLQRWWDKLRKRVRPPKEPPRELTPEEKEAATQAQIDANLKRSHEAARKWKEDHPDFGPK